jgi:hypothetical protein
MNNMDIRCGELQSINVNINWWINTWEEWNSDPVAVEINFIPERMSKTFHSELNSALTNAYEKNYSDEDKYIVMDNLVQEYINNKWIKIKKV